eukprot:scaffold11570_cov114-Isochrysis_galbana.AAC.1
MHRPQLRCPRRALGGCTHKLSVPSPVPPPMAGLLNSLQEAGGWLAAERERRGSGHGQTRQ